MTQQQMLLMTTSRVIDNLLNVIKVLMPVSEQEHTPFNDRVVQVTCEARNLHCYCIDEILKGN